MAALIDISWPLTEGVTRWPGSPGFVVTERRSCARGDTTTDTVLTTDVHVGTHIETSRHVSADGASVDRVALDRMLGVAWVADLSGAASITAKVLASRVPDGVRRLLLRTDNSQTHAPTDPFDPRYTGFTIDGADWVAEAGIGLVGIDYLSIQIFDESPAVHSRLFESDVLVLEGLRLSAITEGWYDLLCLPMAIVGTEAVPCRALLGPCGALRLEQ
jgi:arylformamidase